jgi:hypothetical protein
MNEAAPTIGATDDSDLSAAFAPLRTADVPLRPAFAAALRTRLAAEIARNRDERQEANLNDATDDDRTAQK